MSAQGYPPVPRKVGLLSALTVLLSIPAAGPALAGAWTLEEGRGQIIFSPSLMSTTRRFEHGGASRPSDRFIKFENQMMVEYGWKQGLTLILQSGQRTETFSRDGDIQRVLTTGLGGGARAELWRQDGLVLSAQATATPTLERSLPALDRRFGPRTEADARLLAGYGFALGGWPAFVDAQAGYRWRSGRHADELRLDLTFGIRPLPQLLLLVQALNAVAVQHGAGERAVRMRQHKLAASAVIDITQTWSLQGGVFASAAGRDSLKERGVALAVWRKF
jgi:protein XagA